MWVNVSDTVAPIFTNNISNQTLEEGSALLYDINATDAAFDCFSVNETTNFKINCSGYLENNTRLDVALYWLNITVNDTSGNKNNSLMWVNITPDVTPPTFTNIRNRTVEYGSGLGYDIDATDATNVSCFAVNDTANFKINCTGYLENNTLLNVDMHWLNITVNDTLGNANSSLMLVNVTDKTPPVFNDTENLTIDYKTALGYDINATDLSNVSCFAVNDTTSFKINCSGYLENNTVVDVGFYWINITANDTYGNVNFTLMWVNVTDTVAPIINTVTVMPTTGIKGTIFNITANVTDNYNVSNATAYVQKPDENNTAIISLSLNNGLYNCSWDSSGKTEGTYVIDVIANDNSRNEKEKENGAAIALASYSVNTSINSSVNFTANEHIIVNATEEANTWLNITTGANVTGSIAIAEYSDNVRLVDPTTVTELGRYIDVIVDNDTNNNISFAEIRVDYTDAEITAANLIESTLRLYKYNDSSATWDLVSPGGVETTDNYVWGNVSSFSSFGVFGDEVEEEVEEEAAAAGAPGGGGKAAAVLTEEVETIYECSEDSDCGLDQYCFEHECHDAECFDNNDCKKDESCWNHRCVKWFDMEILEFESPAKIGKFFRFTYFIKAMAEINADVEIRFWIEQDGNIVSSGQDTLYIGSFEEKTKTKKLFLPESISSGVHTFHIEVTYGTYTASAYRTIEIAVEEGMARIKMRPKMSPDSTQRIIYELIGLCIFIVIIIFYIERRKIKKGIIKEGKWIKKHKVSTLAILLFIILGILNYYLRLYKLIADCVPTAVLWSKNKILPYLGSYGYHILGGIAAFIFIVWFIVLMRKTIKIRIEIKREQRAEKKRRAIHKFLHDHFGIFKTKKEIEEIKKERELKKRKKERLKEELRKEIEIRKKIVLNERIKLIEEKRREKERRIVKRKRRREEAKRVRRQFLHDHFGLYKTKAELEEIKRVKNLEIARMAREIERNRREKERLKEELRKEAKRRIAEIKRKRNEARRSRGRFLHDHFGLYKTKKEIEEIKRLRDLEIARRSRERELKKRKKERLKEELRKEIEIRKKIVLNERIKLIEEKRREKERRIAKRRRKREEARRVRRQFLHDHFGLYKTKKEIEEIKRLRDLEIARRSRERELKKRKKLERKIRKKEEIREKILTRERLRQFNRKRRKEEKIRKQIEKERAAAAEKIRKIQEKEQRKKERTAAEEKARQKVLKRLQEKQEKQKEREKIRKKIKSNKEKYWEELRKEIETKKINVLNEKIRLSERKRREKQEAREEKRRQKELAKERRERERERRIAEIERRRNEARRSRRRFLHDHFGLFKTKKEIQEIERAKNLEIARRRGGKYRKKKNRELEKLQQIKEREKQIALKKKMRMLEKTSLEEGKIRKKMEKIRSAAAQKRKIGSEEEKQRQDEMRIIRQEKRKREMEKEMELEKIRKQERIKRKLEIQKEKTIKEKVNEFEKKRKARRKRIF